MTSQFARPKNLPKRPVRFAQFGEHIERINIARVVITEALQAGNVLGGSRRAR